MDHLPPPPRPAGGADLNIPNEGGCKVQMHAHVNVHTDTHTYVLYFEIICYNIGHCLLFWELVDLL